jgi:hypothetical protein
VNAEAEAWSVRMEGYGGPAQPSSAIGQCIHSGLGWLEVECNRCKTRASLPLSAIRRPRDTPLWKLEHLIYPVGPIPYSCNNQADNLIFSSSTALTARWALGAALSSCNHLLVALGYDARIATPAREISMVSGPWTEIKLDAVQVHVLSLLGT